MSLRVRAATGEDSETIGKIQARTWKTTYKNILTDDFLSTIDESERAQAAITRYSNPDIKTFVVTESSNDLPVGFVCMGPSREQSLIADVEVYAIYVLEQHQKSGAGELLLRQALDYLKSQKGKIAFISVFKSNSKARRFYEKMGGQFIGEDFVVIDEVRYQTVTYVWDLAKPVYSLSLATNRDIPEIRKLVNSAYKELADIGLNYTATYQDEIETKQRMSQGRCFVLRDPTRIVATILFYEKNHFTNKKTAYVGQFGVLPELKKSGLGTRLMNYCELLAQNEKYEAIQLDTAIPAKHLVSWYTKRGYNIVGEMHWEGKTYDSYIFEKSFEIIELNETHQDGPTTLDGINRCRIFEVIARRKDHNFKESAHRFLDKIVSAMNKQSIFVNPNWSVDHLCYRVSRDSEYHLAKEQFSTVGELLIESEVNGRFISTYKLFEPIKYKHWQIPLLELPAPKKNKVTSTGFEHIEIVCDVPFSELESKFKSNDIDVSGLAKSFNKEFEVKLDGCAVKFHHLSLESVIRLEKNKSVFNALIESKVLQTLEEYNPVVAGTFPLGIFTDKSDLDILLECYDLDRLQETAKNSFGLFTNFKSFQIEVDGINTLIINFSYGEVPFELFAQPTPSVKQKAYRHFQVEERLLAMGNEAFIKTVSELRKQGLKTEPAFAKALSIERDPYEELLKFHSLSYEELKEKIPAKFHRFQELDKC